MKDALAAFDRVLVIAPHTDDEFGCAGTVHRLIRLGADVHYVALSDCYESRTPGFDGGALARESRACLAALGLMATNWSMPLQTFSVRHFPQFRQGVLSTLIALRDRVRPDLVLLPSSFDTHQDHRTVYEEGVRAFKATTTMLGYELPQNTLSFENTAFVALDQFSMDQKIAALSEYKSQAHRPYANADFIRSLARVRGVQGGFEYAEAFEVIRWVIR